MIRRSLLTLSLVSLVSCDSTSSTVANSLNLARPVDIAFACYGGYRNTHGTPSTDATPEAKLTAQPTTSCAIRSAERYIDPNADDISAEILNTEPRPPGQQDVGSSKVGTTTWYGFILQSASGTVALSAFAPKPASQFAGGNTDVYVIDADPLTPGKNAISVGEDPVGIETDKSGCYEVVANGGSCDVSTIDINSVLGTVDGSQAFAPAIKRLPIVKPNGETLYAKPAAIVGEEGDAVIGNVCPAKPSGIAYVALPSCHVVAAVDMSDAVNGDVAQIVAAIQFDAAGVATQVTDLNSISCPVECTGTGMTPTAPTPGVRPSALAYRFDPDAVNTATNAPDPRRRLAIGASNSSKVTVVDLADAYPAMTDPANPYVAQPKPLPTALTQVTLEDTAGNLGISQIALSQQIELGGSHGAALPVSHTVGPAGSAQYVYAVASDRSVRVADVLGYNQPVTECDTQVDTRFLQPGLYGADAKKLQCIPVSDKAIRRPSARGPGIQLPDDGAPVSAAFVRTPVAVDVNGNPTIPTAAPGTLFGTFAVIASVAGPTYVVNVEDDNKPAPVSFDATQPQATQPTLLMAHQLRHNFTNPGEGDKYITSDSNGNESVQDACLVTPTANRGAPRTTAAPTQSAAGGTAATGTTATSKVAELPTLRQVTCTAAYDAPNGTPVSELQLSSDPITRQAVYPDLGGMLTNQVWTMTYEGQLSLDSGHAVNGPTVRTGEWVTNSTASASLNDQTQPFCSLGVEDGDIVQMHGCVPSNNGLDCPQGYECYVHGDTEFTLAGSKLGQCFKSSDVDQLAPACRDYLISSRQFTVRYSSAGQLELAPRMHELRTTPLDGCTDDMQCKDLADYSVQNGLDQFSTTANVDHHTWACMADPTRKPRLNGSTKRCVETCAYHEDARDADCDVGSICVGAKDKDTPGVCMDSVIPPQACMAAPQKLDIRAGEAFTLVSDVTGYTNPWVRDASDPNGKCVLDPKYADPKVPNLEIGRIPLDAPACVTGADPVTGKLGDGTFEPNPCSLMTTTSSNELSYGGDSCGSPTTTLTTRTNVPAIKLRTQYMTLTLVDPYYNGDARCPVDRGGASQIKPGDRIPVVFSSYGLGFTLQGGLTPVQLQSYESSFNPVIPTRVVEGPTGSIWVLDDGDFLSTTLGLASTEGSVFRVESYSLAILNQLQ